VGYGVVKFKTYRPRGVKPVTGTLDRHSVPPPKKTTWDKIQNKTNMFNLGRHHACGSYRRTQFFSHWFVLVIGFDGCDPTAVP